MLEFNIPTLKYLSYRHGQIAYVDTGEGPTLFLLHGMNGNSKSWANLFHSLNSFNPLRVGLIILLIIFSSNSLVINLEGE